MADVLEIASKWRDTRRDVRQLLGDDYDERMGELRKVVRRATAARPRSEFVAVVVELAGELAKRTRFGGAFALAAGLDELEELEEQERTVRRG